MFVLVGCQETYYLVNTKPPQILVADKGDEVNRSNIEYACARNGQVVDHYVLIHDHDYALVTCKEGENVGSN